MEWYEYGWLDGSFTIELDSANRVDEIEVHCPSCGRVLTWKMAALPDVTTHCFQCGTPLITILDKPYAGDNS